METISLLFEYLLTGMNSMLGFLQTLPTLLTTCVQAFPPVLGAFLISCFGIILAIRVLELLP